MLSLPNEPSLPEVSHNLLRGCFCRHAVGERRDGCPARVAGKSLVKSGSGAETVARTVDLETASGSTGLVFEQMGTHIAKQTIFGTEGGNHKTAGQKTHKADFDRNREGQYGGLAETPGHKSPTRDDKNPKR